LRQVDEDTKYLKLIIDPVHSHAPYGANNL